MNAIDFGLNIHMKLEQASSFFCLARLNQDEAMKLDSLACITGIWTGQHRKSVFENKPEKPHA